MSSPKRRILIALLFILKCKNRIWKPNDLKDTVSRKFGDLNQVTYKGQGPDFNNGGSVALTYKV